MEHNIVRAFIQARKSHPGICTIVVLLIFGDFTRSYERKIQHQINRTALMGETVILHCNETLNISCKDIGWHKDGTLIFMYSPVLNQTITNYTSSRMQVDPQNPRKLQIPDVQLSDAGLYSCFPFNIHWLLTIKDESDKHSQSTIHYLVLSVTGVITICAIIFCVVCIHRKWKRKSATDHRDTLNEPQPHGRRINCNTSSQYFERFNSVYGQI